MKISFIVPAYNTESTIKQAVESIFNQKGDYLIEVIIVDDGSRDGTLDIAEELKSRFPNIFVIHQDNSGEASALNAGLDRASGEIIAIVEADVEIEEYWLKKVLKRFKDERVMGVGGRLITPKDDPWIARLAGYEVEYKLRNNEEYPMHITSANAIYRKEVFERFGRFDEQLKNSCLDADLNLRIIKNNYKLCYVKEAVALHHFKTNFLDYMKRQYAYARYRPYLRGAALYKTDYFLMFQILLTGILLFSLPVCIIWPWSTLSIFLVIILIQLPMTIRLLFAKKSIVVLYLPFLMVIRNIVGLTGYCVGLKLQKS
ncbi:glycosyltransferase [bacterium]|nr:glycosyltransferase [bacterium]